MNKNKWVQRILPISLGIAIFIVLTAIFFIVKERQTLERLMHPESIPAPTTLYSRWLDLTKKGSMTPVRLQGWLDLIGYKRGDASPVSPGEYSRRGNTFEIFARPFRYPDQDAPAQLIRVELSDHEVDSLTAVSGKVDLESWRLEPYVLAQWDSYSKTAKERVRIDELPPHVPRAVLAIEDKRFFDHGAFDLLGIARAFWVDVRHASLKQGASTITQQLSRSIFLDVQRTWRRKFFEAIMAVYLELRYTKPQLLEMYLNQVYWGQDGAQSLIGMESASRSFFGKSARQLSPAESATLAGMLQSPKRYSPRYSARASEERKRIVLGLMKDQGIISPEEYLKGLVAPITLVPPKAGTPSAYFLAMLRADLAERYEMTALLSQGWRVFTTLDPLLQKEAVQALKPSVGQAGFVSLDSQTGAMRAWVGGTNFQTNPFDHVSEAHRQPGSAFKPFVVLSALESQQATAATILEDAPLQLKGQTDDWSPQNYDRKFRGKVTVWDSLALSLNVPIVRLAMLVGIPHVIDLARRTGITSPLRGDLSTALGSSEVSLLELSGAYGVFASGGRKITPYSIEAILTQDGRPIETHMIPLEPVIEPRLAYAVTQILKGVMTDGTGRAAKVLGFDAPSAGKTGTSENYHDAWFIGFTPALVSGVWVGYDQPKSLGRSAAGIALPIWVDYMKRITPYDPPTEFKEPEGIAWKSIDPASGMLAKTGCPMRRKMAFVEGTEPKDDCSLHAGGIKGLFERWRSKT